MNILILSDDRKQMHYLAKVTSPEVLKVPKKGNLSLDVEIFGFCKTYSSAVVRAAEERFKQNG